MNVECCGRQLETHVSVLYGESNVKCQYKGLSMPFIFFTIRLKSNNLSNACILLSDFVAHYLFVYVSISFFMYVLIIYLQ